MFIPSPTFSLVPAFMHQINFQDINFLKWTFYFKNLQGYVEIYTEIYDVHILGIEKIQND